MNDKKDKKGVSGVERTKKSSAISQVEALEEVSKVKKTGAVGRTRGASGATDGAGILRYADREQIMNLVEEEAAKLFANSKLPAEQKRLIREAVKMTIDSSLVPEEQGVPEEQSENSED